MIEGEIMKQYIMYKKCDNVLILKLLVKRLDFYYSSEILQHISKIVTKFTYINVLIDFCNIKTMSSSGIGLLLIVNKRLNLEKRKLGIVNINPIINKVIHLLEVHTCFNVFNNMYEALKMFSDADYKKITEQKAVIIQ